jgi:transcription elongation factor SPT5
LAQVLGLSENGEEATVKFIPRIDLTPKDENTQVGPDGKKRRKAFATPLAFRPPQRLFNPEAIGKAYGQSSLSRRPGGIVLFRNDEFKDGFCEKDIRLTALTIEDVTPTIDELTRFQGENGQNGEALDLASIAEMARKVARTILQPGDHVEVFEGDQKGIHGTVDSISNEVVTLTPDEEHELGSIKVEVPTKSVRKRFRPGDHVKVMQGSNADETGLVVKVEKDTVTFLSDLSSTEVSVFTKDVREAAEIGSGVNVIGGYELHDLVQLE